MLVLLPVALYSSVKPATILFRPISMQFFLLPRSILPIEESYTISLIKQESCQSAAWKYSPLISDICCLSIEAYACAIWANLVPCFPCVGFLTINEMTSSIVSYVSHLVRRKKGSSLSEEMTGG